MAARTAALSFVMPVAKGTIKGSARIGDPWFKIGIDLFSDHGVESVDERRAGLAARSEDRNPS
jgi:hypothetical protein